MRPVPLALLAALCAVLAGPAMAQDSEAPKGALPHYLPPERWVYQHWLPYDEDRLYRVLGRSRGQIWRHLRDDARHDLAQLARRRGLSATEAARRLVAPRRAAVTPRQYRRLLRRARRTLTQGHMSQHLLFHSLHQLAIPDRAREIFGTPSVGEYLRLRRAEVSPQQIGRLYGRRQEHVLTGSRAALRAEARKGVRNGSFTRRQARVLLDRQLRQVPRFLGQSRYNGPPQTGPALTAILPPNDHANGPSITADGSAVVFDAYRATIRDAKTLGEIRVQHYDVASGRRTEVSHHAPSTSPLSAYNSQVSADGGTVVFERAAGNRNFGKRYGAMHVLVRVLAGEPLEDVSHAGRRRSRTAYNPSLSADGRLVAYETSDDGGPGGRSRNALEIRDRTTGRVRRIAGGGDYAAVYEPRLSGDGRSVAFTVAEGGSSVYVRRLATGAGRLVARDAHEPAMSHDGTRVAYTSGPSGRAGLRVRDLGSRRVTRIGARLSGHVLEPALSPGGDHVAFAVRRGDRARVHLADVRTGVARSVSPAVRGVAGAPVVSADGSRVAYTTTAALPGKPHGTPGVVLADLTAGTTTLLSTHARIKRSRGVRASRSSQARAASTTAPGAMLCELSP